ncbi:ABC transporter substrate-binding protein [Lacisediminihabitans sp.]|uniref:ABC transporter substrate-binding protein n=1 Tax=Lacisediminihabitans sp. TaxID=2787631 RepID=UPI002F926370
MPSPRTLVVVALSAALCLAVAGCATDAPKPVPTTTPSSSGKPTGDGVLRIGTVFPTTGAQAYLGPAQAAAVEAAVREINEAGGVLGKPVEVLHRDSGDVATDTLEKSLADLQSRKVDVLIGPSSSVLAERLVPKLVAAGIPMISPAATSVRLSTVADFGLFFRTIPSAALEGDALARAIGGGKARVAYVYLDDDTGAAILGSLRSRLKAGFGSLVATQKFDPATKDFAPIVAAVKKTTPDAVVFASTFAAMEQNKAVITALTAAGLGGAKLWLTGENMADYSQALPAGTLTGVNGILAGAGSDAAFTARVKAADPAASNMAYAPEAFDATILAALAATVARDASGPSIAARLTDVSRGGIKCTSFGECVAVLKTRSDIDYDGISGPIAFDKNGDPSSAHFGVYKYDAANRFTRAGDTVGG